MVGEPTQHAARQPPAGGAGGGAAGRVKRSITLWSNLLPCDTWQRPARAGVEPALELANMGPFMDGQGEPLAGVLPPFTSPELMLATDSSLVHEQAPGSAQAAALPVATQEALKGSHPLMGELGPLEHTHRCGMVNAAADVGVSSLLVAAALALNPPTATGMAAMCSHVRATPGPQLSPGLATACALGAPRAEPTWPSFVALATALDHVEQQSSPTCPDI